MDQAERNRYKQLANDAIIASYGYDNMQSRLAEALEKCVEWIEEASSKCATCSICQYHGDHWDDNDYEDWELDDEDE